MPKTWQVQDAKARFSALLDAAVKDGPQIVTRRGIEAAVLVPIDQWRQLEANSQPNLKDLLMSSEPRADIPIPPRGKTSRRTTPELA